MRIGIDCSCWHNQRGFGRFTRGLVPALLAQGGGHEFVCFADDALPADVQRAASRVVKVDLGRSVRSAAVADGRRGVADVLAFTRATLAHPTDVFLFPAVYSWFPLPPLRKSVVTVHDAIAEQFPELVFPNRRGRLFWTAKMRLALWQATRVLTVSHSAKRDIVRVLNVADERVDVTTEGIEPWFRAERDEAQLARVRAAAGLPPRAPYLVYVGGLAPHKNLAGLVRGFDIAASDPMATDLRLAVVGDPKGGGFHSCAGEIHDLVAASARLRERVVFTGFVDDAWLPALYTGALAAVMPAFSEGFGLPALEALACGTPVLSHKQGAVPEVIGDAGLVFDTYDPKSIAASIVRLVAEPGLATSLRARAPDRVAAFSWTRAAALTMESVARAGKR